MKTLTALVTAAFVVAVALPAWAGSGEKCTADVQTCLNKWSTKKTSGWLGLEYDKSEAGKLTVKAVTAGSPAEQAGFKAGDVILALNGANYSDKEAVKKAQGDWTPGQKVSYTVLRDGKDTPITATLGSLPDNVYASMVGRHMLDNHVSAQTAVTTEAPAPTK